ncbi:MAG: acyltransferase [Anaerolineales bacterium]|nr:acyltransferase [Anaerolineales bacterium]
MIAGLDGLRAVAFLIVFFFHTRNLPFGWLGVQLFFVLSGFLITDILLRMKEKLPRREFFIKFYGRRFLRIFPLYYFYLLLIAVFIFIFPALKLNLLNAEIGKGYLNQVWVAALYVYDFFHASVFFERSRFFTHLWSLSVEEQFYLLWPLLIFLTPRDKFKQLCFTAIGLGFIFRLIITLVYRTQALPFLSNDPQQAVNVLPFSHLDAFAFGAYISRFEIPRPRLQLLVLSIAIPAIGLLTDYASKGTITFAFGYDLPMTGYYKEVWAYTLLNYLFAVLIYCVARTNLFTQILDSAPLRYLGKISYGLYVYHYGMIALVAAIFKKYGLGYSMRSPQMFLAAMSATLLIATVSFYLLEKPIIDLKDKLFRVSA